MGELVERLREQEPNVSGISMYWGRLMKESADEIERLTALVAETRLSLVERGQEVYRMRAALREISEWRIVPRKNGPFSEQRWFSYEGCAHTLRDIARSTLEKDHE